MSHAEVEKLQNALGRLTEEMDTIFQKAKSLAEESMEDFATSKFGCMVGQILNYATCMETMGVTNRADLENLIKQFYKNEDIQEYFDTLISLEQEWNSFLEHVENAINPDLGNEVRLKEGDSPDLDIPLVDVETNKEVNLKDYLGDMHLVLVLMRHFA